MIHLVWLGPITKFIQYKIQHFEKMCPNHKIMVYYNDNELLNIYKYTYNKYCKTPYAKSDLIRHSVLQKYGGWYFDFDITLLRPIQDIIIPIFYIVHWDGMDGQLLIIILQIFLLNFQLQVLPISY
jgi:hypothetical protein